MPKRICQISHAVADLSLPVDNLCIEAVLDFFLNQTESHYDPLLKLVTT